MAELPTGTVTLLFSDIEGSTVLLSRLGPAYADALDGQRQVLRKAWAEHGGTELGTEGDSFYVVFPTAEAAVAAATQAQRDLAAFKWPAGEQLRVRMGIHTGAPTPHDGAYVGMDVHRAARVAGAAHGGQVVISSTTAELVGGCLPERVSVRDLGSHQLKDIPLAEHLLQLTIEGLPSEFPPPKTLGAASSLPRPATPLVGRDGEVAELTALLRSPDVRLATLTGPGGSGKTRLAIGVAEQLVERFPDGVYFVPLAAATTAEVMWTSIAEVLDVPPEGRIPPGLFEHVAHRSALFVLDNLEQVSGADAVVDEMLAAAPQVVAIATSRRPLHVPLEHEHAVPPLELPEGTSVGEAERSGAVQLFVQRARRVKATFSLTAENAADVAAVCRRLDALPLAIELAAARSKLLSPKALLARLDQALDIVASGSRGPSRQKTLRDTIGWSYDLLTPQQQLFFRHLGVFAGGADLDAITAITTDFEQDGNNLDPFDLVTELVDASLITVTETPDGEPRVGMFETIRAYAIDQLTASKELDALRERHAKHYLRVAEQTSLRLRGDQYMTARSSLQTEHDNLREALGWAVEPHEDVGKLGEAREIGCRLCIALARFWEINGYYSEQRLWLERVIHCAEGSDNREHARCLTLLAGTTHLMGDPQGAYTYALASVRMWERLGLQDEPTALLELAVIQSERDEPEEAHHLFQRAVIAARRCGDNEHLCSALGNYSWFHACEGNYETALELYVEALNISETIGDPYRLLTDQHNMACLLRQMGRIEQAKQQMHSLIPKALKFNDIGLLPVIAEDYAAVLAELGEHDNAVRLLGATDAMRERLRSPRGTSQKVTIAEPIAKTRAALTTQEWEDAYQAGRHTTVEDALTQAHAATLD